MEKNNKCVMCNSEGEYLAEETQELLCKKHYEINAEIRRNK